MTAQSTLNIDLLKQVRDKIATTPESYEQRWWANPSNDAPCGTTACIGGWAVILSGAMTDGEAKEAYSYFIAEEAARVLGLNSRDAKILFSATRIGWPLRFRMLAAFNPARAAVSYLNRIIRTGKVR